MYSHKKKIENENCISGVWIRNKRLQAKLKEHNAHSALRTLGRLPGTLFCLKNVFIEKILYWGLFRGFKVPKKGAGKKVTALFKAFMRKFDTKPEIWLRQKKPKTPWKYWKL